MNTKTYTPEQLSIAERVAKAVASVPESKQASFVTMIEAMLVGVTIADQARSA